MAKKNLALKIAIVESGLSQVDVAEAVDLHESHMSNIVNGRRAPNETQQKAIAGVINAARLRRGLEQLEVLELFEAAS